jgi:hypothetical protein
MLSERYNLGLEVRAMARRSLLATGGFGLVAALGLAQACGGSSDVAPDGGDASTEGGANDDAAATDGSLDGSKDGSIDDGGANIDPDAGDDAPDSAACNNVVNDAPPITSTCVSAAPVLGGGALVAGKYHLVGVAALGTQSFCQTRFVPTGFKETAELTVDAQGVGTAETHTNIGGGGSRRRTTTLTPSAGNTSPLQATSTCPIPGTAPTPYFSGVVAGKQQLVLRLAYGKGEALYRFTIVQ